MADLNLQEIHDTLVDIASEAGKMIMAANPSSIDQGTKLNCECASHPAAFPRKLRTPAN